MLNEQATWSVVDRTLHRDGEGLYFLSRLQGKRLVDRFQFSQLSDPIRPCTIAASKQNNIRNIRVQPNVGGNVP